MDHAVNGDRESQTCKRTGININTVSAMEKNGADCLTSGLDKVRAVMTVLEEAGIEFLKQGSQVVG